MGFILIAILVFLWKPFLRISGTIVNFVLHKTLLRPGAGAAIKENYNYARNQPQTNKGHYESFFQRANHPTRPLAFWIRYTVFKPAGRPKDAIGELWAIWFDGEKHEHKAFKREVPYSECEFDTTKFSVRIGTATLQHGALRGEIPSSASSQEGQEEAKFFSWDLTYQCDSPPLFDFPHALYQGSFPKAKALVGSPQAIYSGKINMGGEESHDISGWVGSQNHNWGSKHTDYYAWGQVAGFDEAPTAFLELGTGSIKLGPIWTPYITILTLRLEGKEYSLNAPNQWFRKGHFKPFEWHFHNENAEIALQGKIWVDPQDVVGLKYYNPPGGVKACLNSKIASCQLDVTFKNYSEKKTVRLSTKNRAAFEILTDDLIGHGIELQV